MTTTVKRRLPVLGLLTAAVAALPFLHTDLGAGTAFLPVCVTAIVAGDLLTAALLAAQFLARGTAPLLGLAAAYLFAGALAVAHALVLPGALDHDGVVAAAPSAGAWIWALGHAGLPPALAAALWGGPAASRRALAAPTVRRGRVTLAALTAVAVATTGLVAAVVALGDRLPAVADGDGVSHLGAAAGLVLLGADLGALIVVARRGRRSPLERRLLLVAACAMAGTALTVVAAEPYTLGWYAADVLQLVASAIVAVTLLAEVGRLGAFRVADRRAGARDALTGALTRGATIVAAEHLHTSRAGTTPLALALLDVDRLRAIGDAHGPLAADAVLLTVAGRLRAQLRDEDVLGRAGEEGFLVLLPGTDAEGATQALDRAVADIRDHPVGTWAHDVRTTASAGIAMVGNGEDAVARALVAADLALNRAKAHGRDQVVSPARALVVPLRRAGAGSRRG
jgi:diguanylate cyclase (GGDEF)-like protein